MRLLWKQQQRGFGLSLFYEAQAVSQGSTNKCHKIQKYKSDTTCLKFFWGNALIHKCCELSVQLTFFQMVGWTQNNALIYPLHFPHGVCHRSCASFWDWLSSSLQGPNLSVNRLYKFVEFFKYMELSSERTIWMCLTQNEEEESNFEIHIPNAPVLLEWEKNKILISTKFRRHFEGSSVKMPWTFFTMTELTYTVCYFL